MSVFTIMSMALTTFEVISKIENIEKFFRLVKRFFGKISEPRQIINAIYLWLTTINELSNNLTIKLNGRNLGALTIREYIKQARKLNIGDKIEIEGIFSRFFPLIIDESIESLTRDLKTKMKQISKELDTFLKEINKENIDLYPDLFQTLLNYLEFGDEFRFRTTATIRDIPLKFNDKYLFLSALYPVGATINLGALPALVLSNKPNEPKYHTFYARVRGNVGKITKDNQILKPVIVMDWDSIEIVDRDTPLYLSQWALIELEKEKETFVIVPRCDLSNPKSYEISRNFLKDLIAVERKVYGLELHTLGESDMVDRIDKTYDRKSVIKKLKEHLR